LTYTATTVKLSATLPPFQHLCMHADGVNTFVAFFFRFPFNWIIEFNAYWWMWSLRNFLWSTKSQTLTYEFYILI
jgi:hypothetical protein